MCTCHRDKPHAVPLKLICEFCWGKTFMLFKFVVGVPRVFYPTLQKNQKYEKIIISGNYQIWSIHEHLKLSILFLEHKQNYSQSLLLYFYGQFISTFGCRSHSVEF